MPTQAFANTKRFNINYCRSYDPIIVRPIMIQDLVSLVVQETGCRQFKMIRLREESCPSVKPRKVKFATVNHRELVTTEVIERDMKEHGVRPATLKELLFFFLEHRNLYDGRELAALGTKKIGSMIEKKSTDEFVFYLNVNTFGVADKNTKAKWPTHVDFLGVVSEEEID